MTSRGRDVHVVAAVRTPIGRHGGLLSGHRPDDLAAAVIAEATTRSGLDSALIDEVVFGATNQAGEDNRNVARMAALLAGLPTSVPGFTVNRLCASGLTAVTTGRALIAAGDADVVIAGGVESMTRAPWVMAKPSRAWGPPGAVHDTSIGWRFTNPRFDTDTTQSMPQTAENVARRYTLSRDDPDKFAFRSHQRAIAAGDAGRFAAEILTVETVSADEGPRRDTSIDTLSRLRPVTGPDGLITAGNSSALNDGAAAVVLASEHTVRLQNLSSTGRLISAASAGVDPAIMGIGPVPATEKALRRAGWRRRPRRDRTQRGLRRPVAGLHP